MSAKKGKYRLRIVDDFSSSHQLRNYNGKCENLHGHNFSVEVVVEGEKLDPEVEFLIDFKVLKKMLKEVLSPLDHVHLNEFPPFDIKNPSSENLAQYIYKEMKKKLEPYPHISLCFVSVAEKETSRAYYLEE